MDWAKNWKIWKKITKFIVRLTRERKKKIWKILKNLAMFFELFFFQKKHQIGPVHFRPKKEIATWQMLGVEFFFKLEFDGGSIGVQHVRSKFFFFSGTADIFLELAHFWLFWSKFSGVNGRNFCEDWTYKKKKKKKEKGKKEKKGNRRFTRPF